MDSVYPSCGTRSPQIGAFWAVAEAGQAWRTADAAPLVRFGQRVRCTGAHHKVLLTAHVRNLTPPDLF